MNEQPNGLPKPKNMTEWSDLLARCIENTKTMSPDASSTLLDQAIAICPDGRGKGINAALEAQIGPLEERLPNHLKGEAKRFIKVAMLTFQKKDDLQNCTPASFLRCVLEAAQYGFAIDGRLFYAVSRWNRDKGCNEAQCMPSYLGLLAVCKRAGAITDCEARVVGPKDQFELWFDGGTTHLLHKPDFKSPVNEADLMKSFQGVYVRLWLPHEPRWVVEYMSAEEIRKVAGSSDSFKKGKGPWIAWFFEMAKKAVYKRSTKTRVDDPAYAQLLELDDREYERTPDPDAPIATGTPVKPVDDSQMGRLTAALGEPESFTEGKEAAPLATEATLPPPSTVASPADEPAEPTADDEEAFGDEVNLDNLTNSLSQATTAWEVDDIATGYAGVFKTEAVKVRGRAAATAAKARVAANAPPPPAKSKGKPKQKSMVETSPQYD